MEFLDTAPKTVWKEDYAGALVPKGKTFDETHRID